MKLKSAFSHHNGVEILQSRGLYEWASGVFEAPGVTIRRGTTAAIRDHVKAKLEAAGWAFNVAIDAEVDLTVFARKDDLAFQLQTGNISRYSYDLLKLQHMYITEKIECAILAVPTKESATMLGDNLANSERIWGELEVFNRTISLPIMVISFE